MRGRNFELNEDTLSIIEEIGGHMPGGFFIYKADEPEELIYANKAVFDIYGCDSLVKVEFESAKVTLRSGAFTNCWGLKEIAAPTGLYGVESDSFEDCPNLDQRAIPGLLDI